MEHISSLLEFADSCSSVRKREYEDKRQLNFYGKSLGLGLS